MDQNSQYIPLQDAEQIIDAINETIDHCSGPQQCAEYLLTRLQQLMNRKGLCNIGLYDQLDRQPAPRVLKRFSVGDLPEDYVYFDEFHMQATVDDLGPLAQLQMPRIRDKLRTPFTVVCSEDIPDKQWFTDVLLARYLKPAGFVDSMIASWAASPTHALSMSIVRSEGEPPFSASDRDTLSLMLRALGPLIDREVFQWEEIVGREKLSNRQREVLLHLLGGENEKQIAASLNRSVHTIHSFVKQLYTHFDVSSRGELLALFVDRAVLRALES